MNEMNVKCCFLIDATGSMNSWLNATKTQTAAIVSEIQQEHPEVHIEIAAVFYRDFDDDEQYRIIPFTDDIPFFLDKIRDIEAIGGHDICEDMSGGFERVLHLDWTGAAVKNLFLIADAPPHGRAWHSPEISDRYPDDDFNLPDIIREVADCDIKLTIVKATMSKCLNKMIQNIDNIFTTAGKSITVSDLIPQSEDLTLFRTISMGVSESIKISAI